MASYSKYSKLPGDSILALLEPGEYVLNRNAVDAIGEENLNELNFEDSPRFKMDDKTKTFQKKLIEKYLHGTFDESNDKGYWWESLPIKDESNDKGFKLPIKDESNDKGFELHIINPTGLTVGGMLGDMIGMQAGGSTLTYGGATTETKSLEDVYKSLGIQPKFEQREKYENQFAYDPSREGVLFEDYGRNIQSATTSGRDALEKATSAGSQYQAKSGFMGTGAGPDAVGGARDSIMSDFLQKEAAAKSTLFKDVRSERENWFTEATRGLGQLESEGGTIEYNALAFSEPTEDDDTNYLAWES